MRKAGFHELEKSKQEEFMDQLRLRGLDASRVIGVHLDTAAYDAKIQINADLASSHLVAYYHTVYNVAEMKKIGGVPDSMVRASTPSTATPARPARPSAEPARSSRPGRAPGRVRRRPSARSRATRAASGRAS